MRLELFGSVGGSKEEEGYFVEEPAPQDTEQTSQDQPVSYNILPFDFDAHWGRNLLSRISAARGTSRLRI